MNNFRGGRPGGRRDFGGSRSTVMHQAICDKCGASCEVPFRPSGDKPIFCNNCFRRKDGRDDRPRRSDNNQDLIRLLEQINDKLDKILTCLTANKPKKTVKKEKK